MKTHPVIAGPSVIIIIEIPSYVAGAKLAGQCERTVYIRCCFDLVAEYDLWHRAPK